MAKTRATVWDWEYAPMSSVEATRRPARVKRRRMTTGSAPPEMRRSAHQPAAVATMAMPPKLNMVYQPMLLSSRPRRSTK